MKSRYDWVPGHDEEYAIDKVSVKPSLQTSVQWVLPMLIASISFAAGVLLSSSWETSTKAWKRLNAPCKLQSLFETTLIFS